MFFYIKIDMNCAKMYVEIDYAEILAVDIIIYF